MVEGSRHSENLINYFRAGLLNKEQIGKITTLLSNKSQIDYLYFASRGRDGHIRLQALGSRIKKYGKTFNLNDVDNVLALDKELDRLLALQDKIKKADEDSPFAEVDDEENYEDVVNLDKNVYENLAVQNKVAVMKRQIAKGFVVRKYLTIDKAAFVNSLPEKYFESVDVVKGIINLKKLDDTGKVEKIIRYDLTKGTSDLIEDVKYLLEKDSE